MKALLLYPRFPNLSGLMTGLWKRTKAVIPPLGIITALLPKDWDIRFYDRNVNPRQMVIGSGVTWLFSLRWFRS